MLLGVPDGDVGLLVGAADDIEGIGGLRLGPLLEAEAAALLEVALLTGVLLEGAL